MQARITMTTILLIMGKRLNTVTENSYHLLQIYHFTRTPED